MAGQTKLMKTALTSVAAFAAAAVLLAMLAAAAMSATAGAAYAVTTIDEVSLTIDMGKLNLDPTLTEDTVNGKRYDALDVLTDSLEPDIFNSGLMYWNETYKEIYGIGEGTGLVDAARQYYIRFSLKPKTGYDWPDAVKGLTTADNVPMADIGVIKVILNGEQIDTAMFGFNGSLNILYVFVPIANDLSSGTMKLARSSFKYNGKVRNPRIASLTLQNGSEVKEGGYTVRYLDSELNDVNPKNAGTYYVLVEGKGVYSKTLDAEFKIVKAANPLKVKGKTATVSKLELNAKAQTLPASKVMKIKKKGKGKISYTKLSGDERISINAKTGKVKVAKGLAKGTYKVKVKVKVAATKNYKKATKKATFKITVK